MSPTKSETPENPHKWTAFEEHTILCLIARGLHRIEPGKDANAVYEYFGHKLNIALHNENYAKDISRNQIAQKLDEVLREHRGLLPIIERQRGARITRSMKIMWERSDKRDFIGDLDEWEEGRKVSEMKEWRIRMGLEAPAMTDERMEGTGDDGTGKTSGLKEVERLDQALKACLSKAGTPVKTRQFRSKGLGQNNSTTISPRCSKFSSAKIISNSDDEDMSVQEPRSPTKKDHASFASLPATLQASGGFSWAKGGRENPVSTSTPILLAAAGKKRKGELSPSKEYFAPSL